MPNLTKNKTSKCCGRVVYHPMLHLNPGWVSSRVAGKFCCNLIYSEIQPAHNWLKIFNCLANANYVAPKLTFWRKFLWFSFKLTVTLAIYPSHTQFRTASWWNHCCYPPFSFIFDQVRELKFVIVPRSFSQRNVFLFRYFSLFGCNLCVWTYMFLIKW